MFNFNKGTHECYSALCIPESRYAASTYLELADPVAVQ